jgi:phage terminase large subunit-like protein
MPWQRYVADVALEIDPATGRLAYRELGLTVPRQSGKSTLILALGTHRALGFGDRQVVTYGAQTRNDARKKWEDDYVTALESSRLHRLFSVRKTNGNEAVLFRNRSRWGITSNTEKAGHGGTIDLAFLDEAFSQVDNRMEQAFKPAMITRPQPQFWVVSTAGTPDSVYLRAKVDRGRQLVEEGTRKGVAYFEWSAPDDADPADPEVWRSCMPALGHTITEDAIAADFASMELIEFQRAYLNQWPDRNVTDPVIPADVWSALSDRSGAIQGRPVFAVDANPERTGAAIAVAGRRTDGLGQIEVIEGGRSGTSWVVPRLLELHDTHKPSAIVLDPASPAGAWLPALQEAGIEPVLVQARQMAQACGAFYEDTVERQALRHLDDPRLNAALAGAKKRPLGDAWAWHRRDSAVDISPLVAVTLAWYGLALQAATPVRRSKYEDDAAELMIV